MRRVAGYQTGAVSYYKLDVPIQVDLVAYKSKTTSDSAHLRFTPKVQP